VTQAPTTTGGPEVGAIAAPRIVRQRRVRAGHLGLAVLLVALGGLLAGFAFLASARVADCLAVARPVRAGTLITAADLTTVQINAAPGLAPIPAAQRQKVIGQRAAVTLVAGTLLTRAQLTSEPLVGPDQRQIAIGLKPERVPARALHPGDAVQLVVTPARVAGAANSAAIVTTPPETVPAVVVDTRPPATDGSIVVYVAVAEQDAPRLAGLAVDGRIAMVLTAVR